MGCSSSSKASRPPACAAPVVDGQCLSSLPAAAPPRLLGKGKGKGKGESMNKGKGCGKSKWQIMLEGRWNDYGHQEDMILKRAYMTGQQNARFHLRGQSYEYSFRKMAQINKGSKKERKIRPPMGPRPPKKPLLPKGPMIIITVGTGQPGTVIHVKDPNNPGQNVQVFVPSHAKPGQKLAVPIPAKGETVDRVQRKQEQHDKDHGTKTGWSTGGAVARGGAAIAGVAAVGVGGVILGDHLAGGEMATTIGEVAVDAGETVADGASDAVDAVAEWAPGAADAVGDWAEGAGEDIGDFAVDAADWLGDAAEDIGEFVMDLF